jgi:hypothetical protein
MSAPRIVLVSRMSALDELTRRHGTRMQAGFHARARGLSLDQLERDHAALAGAIETLSNAIPARWRRARIQRAELSRFVFEPNDRVVCVGPDGLVANTAKYLEGQAVIATNPLGKGPLTAHSATTATHALLSTETLPTEARTLVEARVDGRPVLKALNELYLGHRTHQSARYTLSFAAMRARHISSGVIVSTGTGATGWAGSIARETGNIEILPQPTARSLAFLVRELWTPPGASRQLVHGEIADGENLSVTSEMNEGGVLFGDGIEEDCIELSWGTCVTMQVATQALRLVRCPAGSP